MNNDLSDPGRPHRLQDERPQTNDVPSGTQRPGGVGPPASQGATCNHRNPQGRVPKHPPDHNPDATTPITRPVHDREMCTLANLDVVRAEVVRPEVARAEVLAIVAYEHFDRTNWRVADDERRDFVRHASASDAASAALLTVDDLRRVVAGRSTVPSGQIWQDG